MIISVIGTGMVGQIVASKMVNLGHKVYMGTRNANEAKSRTTQNPATGMAFNDWVTKNRDVSIVNYGELPTETNIFINVTSGSFSIDVLKAVGANKLDGKIIIDIANPLDFSNGMPPSLLICNTDSLAENIQKEFPQSKVVKTLNTMNCNIMMDPSIVPGEHSVFMSGNDEEAKNKVQGLLQSIGWKKENIINIGDITTARGTEMLLPIWLRLWGALGTSEFNFHIQKK